MMLEGLEPVGKELSCKVRTILAQLETADATLLEGYLADIDRWPSSQLAKALKTRDVNVSANTLQKHRLGGCSC
jgi:hypothetical protein